ncbi:unnamed protein product [Protopolystoma xenopodis]|uniref:Uncharacterized protein n=1 Tax=Protopolystoma xenopodis TaxID=117903 RepID=A0A448XGR6_9PLAT|nr:unnamed protein product [Protopolystoma xenopodis]
MPTQTSLLRTRLVVDRHRIRPAIACYLPLPILQLTNPSVTDIFRQEQPQNSFGPPNFSQSGHLHSVVVLSLLSPHQS